MCSPDDPVAGWPAVTAADDRTRVPGDAGDEGSVRQHLRAASERAAALPARARPTVTRPLRRLLAEWRGVGRHQTVTFGGTADLVEAAVSGDSEVRRAGTQRVAPAQVGAGTVTARDRRVWAGRAMSAEPTAADWERAAANELTRLTEDMGLYARLAVDANGFVWWAHEDGSWSMARTNPDNKPVPQPVTYYAPVHDRAEVGAHVVTTTEVVTFKYDDDGRVISQTTETVTTATGPVTA